MTNCKEAAEYYRRKKEIDLKPCPYRIHGERTASLTIEGEFYYNESFMPCMREKCPCFHNDGGDPYCDRGGARMKMKRRGEQDDSI